MRLAQAWIQSEGQATCTGAPARSALHRAQSASSIRAGTFLAPYVPGVRSTSRDCHQQMSHVRVR